MDEKVSNPLPFLIERSCRVETCGGCDHVREEIWRERGRSCACRARLPARRSTASDFVELAANPGPARAPCYVFTDDCMLSPLSLSRVSGPSHVRATQQYCFELLLVRCAPRGRVFSVFFFRIDWSNNSTSTLYQTLLFPFFSFPC